MNYIILLLILLAVYIAVLFIMKYFTNQRITDLVFCALVFVPYIWLMSIVYKDVGPRDWNFTNTLPTANVSPFMFTLTPLMFLLPKGVRKYFFGLVSLLSVGMLFSSVLACVQRASIGYKLHFHFVLDYVSHISLSLFGVYLVKSGQVQLGIKNALKSASVIFSAATLMVVLNLIFDTSLFGLSLRGKHNIYNNVLVDSSYLSALLYYLGLAAVLALGYAFCKLMTMKRTNKLNTDSVERSSYV
jgi:hypothetical protein